MDEMRPEDYATVPVAVTITEPVALVAQPGRSYAMATTALTTTPERVANDVPTRRRVTLTATGPAGHVTLGRSQVLCGPTTGFRLPVGESLTMEADGEVWAADLDGAGVSVSVYAEYADGQ